VLRGLNQIKAKPSKKTKTYTKNTHGKLNFCLGGMYTIQPENTSGVLWDCTR